MKAHAYLKNSSSPVGGVLLRLAGTFKQNALVLVGTTLTLGMTISAADRQPQDSVAETDSTTAASPTRTSARSALYWENSLGMRFVRVPVASVHFCIWETRVQDYRAFVEETRRPWSKPPPFFPQMTNHPAVNVSWADANAFCEWLTLKERTSGRISKRQRYRLPSDEEWSRAVGIGQEKGATPTERQNALKVWPWGGSWPPPQRVGNYFDLACKKWHRSWSPSWSWYIIEGYNDGFTHLAPVGSFPPNCAGLYDLGGNVWEWCADEDEGRNVMRGAGWYDSHPATLLSAYRNSSAGSGSWHIGFRVVLANGRNVARSTPCAAYSPATSQSKRAMLNAAPAIVCPSLTEPSKDMVVIGCGTFEMGDTFQENPGAWAQETPAHTVTLGAFTLGRYEVTVEQFRTFIEATGYITDAEREGGASAWVTWDNDTKSSFAPWSPGMNWKKPGFAQSRADPVVCVSWNDAIAYCNWLSQRENLPPAYDVKTGDLLDQAGKPVKDVRAVTGYRLPTEAEWEYAAREKGRKVRFGNGKDVARAEEINYYASQGNHSFSEKGRYRKSTVPVGSFPPNVLGLFDMSGNAWEWCGDCYTNYPAGKVDDPYVSSGPHRILRGGRWGGDAKEIRATARHFEGPSLRCNNSGFRVAKTVSEGDPNLAKSELESSP